MWGDIFLFIINTLLCAFGARSLVAMKRISTERLEKEKAGTLTVEELSDHEWWEKAGYMTFIILIVMVMTGWSALAQLHTWVF